MPDNDSFITAFIPYSFISDGFKLPCNFCESDKKNVCPLCKFNLERIKSFPIKKREGCK